MSWTRYVGKPFSPERYKATNVPNNFNYHANYWLIGKGDYYIDAKRVGPILFLYLYVVLAWMFFYSSYKEQIYTSLAVGAENSDYSVTDLYIVYFNSYIENGKYNFLLSNMLMPIVYFFLGLYILFPPYPRPLRFNQKNGLVYTKHLGRIWVTDWNLAYIKLWRAADAFNIQHRGIGVCMHSIDKKGRLMERYVILSRLNSMKINDLEIGGEPSILYWHWLNEYMQGATFSEETSSNSEAHSAKANGKTVIPAPIIGRNSWWEKILRFRSYKFAKSIDQQAIELDKRLKAMHLYPQDAGDQVPNNPFFPWEHDFPNKEMPNIGEINSGVSEDK